MQYLCADIYFSTHLSCCCSHRIGKNFKMLAIKLTGNNFWRSILIGTGIDLPTVFPWTGIFVSKLPEFSTAIIVAHPFGGQMGSLRYGVIAQPVTGIAIIDCYESL